MVDHQGEKPGGDGAGEAPASVAGSAPGHAGKRVDRVDLVMNGLLLLGLVLVPLYMLYKICEYCLS
ncbi:hypothetical protein [Sphingomonas crocodyli]|uniref:Uncharacterized protein n=1 Tax=Sphingomonas crocodyli TaxID=1979270 RepID=A0A437M5E5_9SPHN|nr:hypothetical protein [Sphingomonas crocodyli]RVT92941.1 hypothetical protein EOD43_03270 [Sphingomonas crocodyli]